MRTKLLATLVVSATLVPGVALADPPDRCPNTPLDITVGEANQILKDFYGPPGQNTQGVPANVYVTQKNLGGRNFLRKLACPPPGQQ